MKAKGITQEFAERVFEQIRGFGDYGFPESHAASFAYIGYVSAWMKRHYPDVFCCALLNAQPMGFYAPATLIDDAKRHGVVVLPVDVQHSHWDCTLERRDATLVQLGRRSPGDAGLSPWAVRVGLRYVKGLREDCGRRIVAAREYGPFESAGRLHPACSRRRRRRAGAPGRGGRVRVDRGRAPRGFVGRSCGFTGRWTKFRDG
jgi:error-prone DNA polymerase